jgi:hypothetical protein
VRRLQGVGDLHVNHGWFPEGKRMRATEMALESADTGASKEGMTGSPLRSDPMSTEKWE